MFQQIGYWLTERRRLRAQVSALDQNYTGALADNVRLREKARTAAVLEKQLASERTQRSLAWPKPERRMKEGDVLGEFDVPMDEPWYMAVHQELDDAISDLLDEVTQSPSAQLSTERRTHVAGGAESLREFQKRLLALRKRAAETDVDLEEKDSR